MSQIPKLGKLYKSIGLVMFNGSKELPHNSTFLLLKIIDNNFEYYDLRVVILYKEKILVRNMNIQDFNQWFREVK